MQQTGKMNNTPYNIIAFAAAAIMSVLTAAGANIPEANSKTKTAAEDSLLTEGADRKYGVTDFSANYMREEPDFSAELGNQVLMGTPVEILGEEGYWKKVSSPEPYEAWCVDKGLVEMTRKELERYISAPKYIFTADYGHIYERPDTGSRRISDLVAGNLLLAAPEDNNEVTAKSSNSRKTVKGGKKAKFVKAWLPSGTAGYIPAENVEKFAEWAESRNADAENIISTAERFLGVPYLWGGTSVKGVDCSGFTRMVWFMNGVLLPRNASQQARAGKEVPVQVGIDSMSLSGTLPQADMKTEMLRRTAQLAPGDLIFFGTPAESKDSIQCRGIMQDRKQAYFCERQAASAAVNRIPAKITHVGIYLGEGRFIHASGKVRISSLLPDRDDYYELSYKMLCARRIIGEEDKGNGVVSMLKSPAYFRQDK